MPALKTPSIHQISFSKQLIYSVGFHVFIILFFAVKTLIMPSNVINIQNSIKVDIVDLPDKIEPKSKSVEQSAPKVENKPAEKVINKPENKKVAQPKIETKKIAKNQNQALDKLKSLQSINKIENELQKEKLEKLNQVKQTYKGNVLNPGDSLEGLDAIDHDKYFSEIKTRVHENFVLPQWLADSNYRAQAVVMIDERGFVINRKLVESSGNPTFDERVLNAIDSSSPFTPPPSRLKNILAVDGLIFNFPK